GVVGAVARGGTTFLEREILQLALACLVTDGTIERMIDEQQLEHAHAAAFRLRRLRAHHHALRHLRGAGDLELRGLLDVHEAHAARAPPPAWRPRSRASPWERSRARRRS